MINIEWTPINRLLRSVNFKTNMKTGESIDLIYCMNADKLKDD